MSFWSEASPVVKGAAVFGAIGIIVVLMMLAGIGPFGGVEDVATQQRGLQASVQ